MKEFIDTGSTLLNLACSGDVRGGLKKGKVLNLIGDSSSGKTYLAFTALACAAYDTNFENYELIKDDVESADEFDIEGLFGSKAVERINTPFEDGVSSRTIEEFYYGLDDRLEREVPFVYVLDSMDSLSSDQESEKFDENKKRFLKGTQTKGSYGDGKAKSNSENLRKIITRLRASGSLLVVISQTRDNIGVSFAPKTRSAGKALEFYSSYVIWMAVTGQITRTVRGNKRVIGQNVRLKITKNKVTGMRYVEIDIPILFRYGIDDVGSMVDWLMRENEWTGSKTSINPKGFADIEKNMKRSDLIAHIEENNLEEKLKDLVQAVWDDIVEKVSHKSRKSRFEDEEEKTEPEKKTKRKRGDSK